MADPLSLAAIMALVYTGKKLSEGEDSAPPPYSENYEVSPDEQIDPSHENRSVITNTLTGSHHDDHGITGVGVSPKMKVEQPSFGDVAFMKHVNGEPVRDFRNRPYVSGQMNNVSPIEKQLVGPGLGVDASVPAVGGYQQLFRVNPNNVGAYKLTTLPGRAGPAADVTGGRRGVVGQLTHEAPAKTAYLPSRYPNVKGRAQGQGGSLDGVTVRGKQEKTKRPTNRSETTLRTDGLGFAPAKKFVSAPTLSEDPTRNKGDLSVEQYQHVNNPAPGIYSFHGGYTNAPSVQMANKYGGQYTAKQLEEFGLRPDEKRSKKNRAGNAGRMNVRADPLNQGGMVTAVRSDCSRVDGRMNPANGGWTQNYIQNEFYQFNSYKGNRNPQSTSRELNIAKNQLKQNPFAHTLST